MRNLNKIHKLILAFSMLMLGVVLVFPQKGDNVITYPKIEREAILDSIPDDKQYLVLQGEDGTIEYIGIDGRRHKPTDLKSFNTSTIINRSVSVSDGYRDSRIEKFHGTPKEWSQHTVTFSDGVRVAYERSGSTWMFNSETGDIVELFHDRDFPAPEEAAQSISIQRSLSNNVLLVVRSYRYGKGNRYGKHDYWVFDIHSRSFYQIPINVNLSDAPVGFWIEEDFSVSLNGKYVVYNATDGTMGDFDAALRTSVRIFDFETWWKTGKIKEYELFPYPGEFKGWITTQQIEKTIPSVKKKDLGHSLGKSATCPDASCGLGQEGKYHLPFPCGVAAYVTRSDDTGCNFDECELNEGTGKDATGFRIFSDSHGYRAIDFGDRELTNFMQGSGLEYWCAREGEVIRSEKSTTAGNWVVVRHEDGDPIAWLSELIEPSYGVRSSIESLGILLVGTRS